MEGVRDAQQDVEPDSALELARRGFQPPLEGPVLHVRVDEAEVVGGVVGVAEDLEDAFVSQSADLIDLVVKYLPVIKLMR